MGLSRGMFLLFSFLCIAQTVLAAPVAEYRLSERLGHQWTQELISFPVEFTTGECRDITRVTADEQAVPFQVPAAELIRHPDGSVQRAKVYVLVNLAPKQTMMFRVTGSRKVLDAPATDLKVSAENGIAMLENAVVGVKLPVGEFTQNIPAPYQGFKLTSGRWAGGSRLMGTPGPDSLKAVVTERGPLFAEVVLTYRYPKERSYTLTCRVIVGEPVALFSETFGLEPGTKFHRNLNYNFNRFVQGRFGYAETFQQSHWVRLSLGDFHPDVDKKDPWLSTLHPWTSWHGGMMMVPLANKDDYLGLLALKAGSWVRPLENLGLVKLNGDEVFVELPVNDGRREWGIHFGLVNSSNPTGEERPARTYPGVEHPSPLYQAMVKYGQSRLEVIKDWQLAWKDGVKIAYPVSINPPGDLTAARKRIADDPDLSKQAKKTIAHWEALRNQKGFPLVGIYINTPDGTEDAYLATGEKKYARELYEVTLARLRYYQEQTISGVGHTNYRSGHSYGMFQLSHFLVGAAHQADLLLGSPEITDDEKADLRAQLAFFAYLFVDQDYWPDADIGKGTYNMYASHEMALGLLGAVLAGHPKAKEWQGIGQRMMDEMLNTYVYPSGAMPEGMHYSGVTLDFALPFITVLKLAGGKDYFTDERLKKGLRWYAACMPPVDVRYKQAYLPPFGYSHNSGASNQSVRWAVAASMTAKTDPEFSKLMMWTWRREGSAMNMVGGEAGYYSALFLGILHPELPVAQNPGLTSAQWKGFGAVLRNHTDSPLETFMAIPTGTPGGFRAYPNEGTFHLYAKGVPLCLRFGTRSFSVIGTQQAWMNNRITFDRRDECTNDTGAVKEFATLSSGDLFSGEYRFTRLAARAPLTEKEPGRMELSEPRIVNTKLKVGEGNGFFGDQQDVPPQLWKRAIMFVKDADPLGPNYFLIRDTFQATLPTDWNLWCLADTLDIAGDKATFTGKYGVDLDVFLAVPRKHIVTGAWGPESKEFFERQKLLQLQQDVNQGYFAALYPRKHEGEPAPSFSRILDGAGIKVELPARTDWTVLSAEPVAAKDGELEFIGRAGFAQRTDKWTRLSLLAGDKIVLGDFLLMHGRQVMDDVRVPTEGPIAVTATLEPGPKVTGEYTGGARKVTINVPVAYRGLKTLTVDGKPAALLPNDIGIYSFNLPEGMHKFELK
ncbi:MAG: hypothetical protein ACYDBB_17895 [Armatimonadota bacterium]